MDLSFYPLTLEAFDQANAEALCLFVGLDERPLVGLSGLCDWRLSGGLSRMLRSGLVKGEDGEALLTPGSKLGFRKLFLFGMGPQGQSEQELAARVAERIRRIGRAGVEDAAFQLPASISLDLGIRTLIDEPNGPLRARVFGLDPAAMVRALSHAASRGSSEARHERRVIKVNVPPKSHPPVRTSVTHKPAATAIPKASPLSFATSPGTPKPDPSLVRRPLSPADAELPIAPLADLTPPPPISTTSAPVAAATPVVSESEAKKKTAAASEKRAANDSTVTAQQIATSGKEAASQKELFVDPASRLVGGKAPLPADYKSPRFVPPEPKAESKKSKRKKR
jgi:hypothetical protein